MVNMINLSDILYWYLNRMKTPKFFRNFFWEFIKPFITIFRISPLKRAHSPLTDASKYMTMIRILSIFICIKLAHVFNRTFNFNLNLFYVCFVQECINEDKTTKTGQFVFMSDMMSEWKEYFMLKISPAFKSKINHADIIFAFYTKVRVGR